MTNKPGYIVKCYRCGHASPLHVNEGPLTGVCRACRAVERGNCILPVIYGPQRDLADFA